LYVLPATTTPSTTPSKRPISSTSLKGSPVLPSQPTQVPPPPPQASAAIVTPPGSASSYYKNVSPSSALYSKPPNENKTQNDYPSVLPKDLSTEKEKKRNYGYKAPLTDRQTPDNTKSGFKGSQTSRTPYSGTGSGYATPYLNSPRTTSKAKVTAPSYSSTLYGVTNTNKESRKLDQITKRTSSGSGMRSQTSTGNYRNNSNNNDNSFIARPNSSASTFNYGGGKNIYK
jgi:hypothetical protein